LPLLLEARDQPRRVVIPLDDLQRHPPLHRLHLIRDKDHAHAAFAKLLTHLVAARE
jgi:hypothetical protein